MNPTGDPATITGTSYIRTDRDAAAETQDRPCPGPGCAVLRRPCQHAATIPPHVRLCQHCHRAEDAAGLADDVLDWQPMNGLRTPL